jgi:hypothetical protein
MRSLARGGDLKADLADAWDGKTISDDFLTQAIRRHWGNDLVADAQAIGLIKKGDSQRKMRGLLALYAAYREFGGEGLTRDERRAAAVEEAEAALGLGEMAKAIEKLNAYFTEE